MFRIREQRASKTSKARWCRSTDLDFTSIHSTRVINKDTGHHAPVAHHPVLFAEFEATILSEMELYAYQTKPLLKMWMPSLFSIIFLPISLVLYPPLVKILWPPSHFDTPPDINDVISSFLVPAGLVYATAFGFSLQEAFAIQQSFREWVNVYNMTIRQIIITVGQMKSTSFETNLRLIKLLKRSYIKCCCEIIKWRGPSDDFDKSCTGKNYCWPCFPNIKYVFFFFIQLSSLPRRCYSDETKCEYIM